MDSGTNYLKIARTTITHSSNTEICRDNMNYTIAWSPTRGKRSEGHGRSELSDWNFQSGRKGVGHPPSIVSSRTAYHYKKSPASTTQDPTNLSLAILQRMMITKHSCKNKRIRCFYLMYRYRSSCHELQQKRTTILRTFEILSVHGYTSRRGRASVTCKEIILKCAT